MAVQRAPLSVSKHIVPAAGALKEDTRAGSLACETATLPRLFESFRGLGAAATSALHGAGVGVEGEWQSYVPSVGVAGWSRECGYSIHGRRYTHSMLTHVNHTDGA